MNFFKRVAVLLRVLYVVDSVMAIGIFIKLLRTGISDIFLNPEEYIFLLFSVIMFAVLLIFTIALRCIKKDAEEDFNAVFKYCQDDFKFKE